MTADGGDDAVDDVEHVFIVAERDGHLLDAAGALDVDTVRSVDHDLSDGVVREQRLDGPEAGDLVDDIIDQATALLACQAQRVVSEVAGDDLVDLPGQAPPHAAGIRDVDAR